MQESLNPLNVAQPLKRSNSIIKNNEATSSAGNQPLLEFAQIEEHHRDYK